MKKFWLSLALLLIANTAMAQQCNQSLVDTWLGTNEEARTDTAIVQLSPNSVTKDDVMLDRRGLAALQRSLRSAEQDTDGPHTQFTLNANLVVVAYQNNKGQIRQGRIVRSLNGPTDIAVIQFCYNDSCGTIDLSWIDEGTPAMAIAQLAQNAQNRWTIVSLPCDRAIGPPLTQEDYNKLLDRITD